MRRNVLRRSLARLTAAGTLAVLLPAVPAWASTQSIQGIITDVNEDGFAYRCLWSSYGRFGGMSRLIWKQVNANARLALDGKEALLEQIKEEAAPGMRVRIVLGRGRPAYLHLATEGGPPDLALLADPDKGTLVLQLAKAASVETWIGRSTRENLKPGDPWPRRMVDLEIRLAADRRDAVAETPGNFGPAVAVDCGNLDVGPDAVKGEIVTRIAPAYTQDGPTPATTITVDARLKEGKIAGSWQWGEHSGDVSGHIEAPAPLPEKALLWFVLVHGISPNHPKKNTIAIPLVDGKGRTEGAGILHYKGVFTVADVTGVDVTVDGGKVSGTLSFTSGEDAFTGELTGTVLGRHAAVRCITRDSNGKPCWKGFGAGRLWPRNPILPHLGYEGEEIEPDPEVRRAREAAAEAARKARAEAEARAKAAAAPPKLFSDDSVKDDPLKDMELW